MSESPSPKARLLIERGDMGIEPGKRYPLVWGDDIYSQIWRATNGATETDHSRNRRWLLLQEQKANPHIYVTKRIAKRKIGRISPLILDVVNASLADVLPRNLTKKQFVNLYSAVSFANSGGIILRAHVTIAWGLLGYSDHDEISEALGDQFIKVYSQWCRDKQISAMWIYTHECSARMGLHTHFLCAVPDDLVPAFRAWVWRRMIAITRIGPPPKKAVKVVAPPSNPLGRQWRVFQYICKSVDPNAVFQPPGQIEPGQGSVFMSDLIQFLYECPGEIKCKNREGTSVNIGPSARKKAGFVSALEKGILDIHSLYGGETYLEWQNWCARQELFLWMDGSAPSQPEL
jgi:hypothetical protein